MMKRRIVSVISVALVAAVMMFALASCIPTAQSSETTETVKKVDLVLPAEAAKDIDLTKADPSNDSIKFYFNEDGSLNACEYKSGDVTYLASYNYRDGKVEVYLYGGEQVVDFVLYTPSAAFDKSVGFTEQDGYYFLGYKELKKEEVETKADTTESTTDTAETSTESETESSAESAADSTTESAEESATETA